MDNVRQAWTAVLLCIAAAAMPAWPGDEREYRLDIDRQPLAQALEDFSEQTDLSYGIFGIRIGEQLVGPLRGRYTAEAALRALLKGTGLTFAQANDGGITLLAEASAPRPKGASVVAEQRPPVEEPRMVVRSAQADPEAPAGLLDEMIVTGTRVRTIRQPAPATLVVLGHERLAEMGVSNAGELMRRITQQPFTRAEAVSVAGAQFASLRGIGNDATVVLIDGRRAFPTASTLVFNVFDLNTIPLAAVERIEVLADSAPALYGADAIGGVINFVLKKRVLDPSLDLDYGFLDGGGEELHAAFSTGGAVGRMNTSLVLDLFDREALLGAQRERWRDQDFRRYGGADWRSLNASPGNIRSLLRGNNLPGLPADYAAVPLGGSDALTQEDFLTTAGKRNYESLSRYRALLPHRRRISAVGHADVPFGSGAEASMDFLYRHESVATQLSPVALGGVVVPAENPFNPFGVPVVANVLLTELGPRRAADEMELLRITAGIRGQHNGWNWELSFVRSDDDGNYQVHNGVDWERVAAAIAAPDPADALNVFGNGRGQNARVLESLRDEPVGSSFISDGSQLLAVLRGPAFSLPAGDATLGTGAEWRREQIAYAYELRSELSISPQGAHDRSVSAAFAELTLPLVSEGMRVPAVRELELGLAARLDRYDHYGSTVNPRYELRWSPLRGLVARAVFAESYRPPSLFDLHFQQMRLAGQVIDPRRNGEIATATYISGGNPSLRPLTAATSTVGLALELPHRHNFRFATALWRIDLENRVSIVTPQTLLSYESQYPERVIRDEPSPEDALVGWAGRIRSIDLSRINAGRLRTAGADIDVSATFDFSLGEFTPNVSATWVSEYQIFEFSGASRLDRVGLASAFGTIPRWRVIADLGWKRSGLGFNVAARYVPSYDDAIDSRRTGRRVSAQTLIDAQISLDLEERFGRQSGWSDVEMRAGVTNLFSEEPPFTEGAGEIGFDFTQGDLTRRFSYLRISKRF